MNFCTKIYVLYLVDSGNSAFACGCSQMAIRWLYIIKESTEIFKGFSAVFSAASEGGVDKCDIKTLI